VTRPATSDRATDPLGRDAHAVAAPLLGWLAGALLLGAVVILVTHRADERELARLLRESEPLWLLAALLLQLLTYGCAAAVWQRALASLGHRTELRRLLPLGLAKLFTDQAVPSAGMSGTLLVVRGLVGRGASRTDAVSAVLTGLVAFYLGYLLATLGAVTIVWRNGELRLAILVPAAALCLLAAALPLGILSLRRRVARRPPRWLERWPGAREIAAVLQAVPMRAVLAPRLLAETALLQLAIFALDALTLDTTLRAVANPVPFPTVFASFVVASVVSTLAWVPGGLGAFEGACVAMLHLHGVSIESALSATLLLRGFTFWLPMLPGLALARRELGRTPESRP
jgi:uncharacterized protein (TIRG00374 family)